MQCYLAKGWEGYVPSGYVGCPRCAECAFSLVATPPAATMLQLTVPGTQGYLERYNCLLDAVYTACVTQCQLKNLGQEQSVRAGISCTSFASRGNPSPSYTVGTKKLQGLLMSAPSLPTLRREQLLLKKRGLIFCRVLCHVFSP